MQYSEVQWASFSEQLSKEAFSLAGMGSTLRGALGSSMGKAKAPTGWILPSRKGLALGSAAKPGASMFPAPGGVAATPGVFQSFGKSLQEGGKLMQRDSTKSLLAGKSVSAGPAARMGGEVAQSVGHHYAHKGTLGNLVNPLGGALGGMAEGITRGAGKELTRGAGALGAHGPAALQGTARTMGRFGTGMQRAAKGVGMAGEVAGLAGLGTAVHAPLSLAGAVGGKIVGGASQALPILTDALHSAGDVVAHGAHDVVGNAAHSAAGKVQSAAKRSLPSMSPQLVHGVP